MSLRNLLKNKRVMAITIAVCAGLLAWFVESRLLITLTPSLSHRVYFMGKPENIVKDDYVVFSLKGDRFAKDSDKILKKVSCVEGEVLKTAGKEYFCDNEFLGKAKDFSMKGERLENFIYNGVVGKGLLFVTGEHKDSYDSRYFGFIRKDQVKAKAHPIW